MIARQPPPVSFDWAADLLMRIMAGIDWLLEQPIVMGILVVVAIIGLIQYAMGS